jgi:hypothetical protein
MNTKIKIPKGWRKLRNGEIVRDRDKYFRPYQCKWFAPPSFFGFTGNKVGDNAGDLEEQPWIRRITRPANRRGGK